jgi:hypothetical protein
VTAAAKKEGRILQVVQHAKRDDEIESSSLVDCFPIEVQHK